MDKQVDELIEVGENQVVTRWVLVAEVYDLQENKKELYLQTEEGMESWDVEAFMQRGIQLTRDWEDEDEDDA